jgi:myxalamid-type polyketide synthase MxaF
VPEAAERAAQLQSDGAYLIVCGNTASAEPYARWMTDCGARNIVILGRAAAIGPIDVPGARVLTVDTDDLGDHEMSSLIAEIETAAGPLRGLIHGEW